MRVKRRTELEQLRINQPDILNQNGNSSFDTGHITLRSQTRSSRAYGQPSSAYGTEQQDTTKNQAKDATKNA